MQRDLLQQKLFELLSRQTHIGDAEALRSARYKAEEVRIAYLAIDGNALTDAQQPGDDEVKRYLEANRDALQTQYDAASVRFSTPEQLKMRHILLKPATDGGEDAAADNRKRAEQVLARLAAGEKFEDLARELSDDSSSGPDGGSLGLIERGDVAPNLEAAAFDLELGKPSEILEGIEGLHIVWVDEKMAASKIDFAEAGLTLAEGGAAEETASRLAKGVSGAVAQGQSLEDAARDAGFTLERTSFFTRRRDGFVPGLSRPSLEVVATAFSLTTEAPSSKQVFKVGNQHVLIQLLERQDPDPASLEDAVASAKESLFFQRQNALLQAWVDNRKEEFESQQRLVIDAALIAER